MHSERQQLQRVAIYNVPNTVCLESTRINVIHGYDNTSRENDKEERVTYLLILARMLAFKGCPHRTGTEPTLRNLPKLVCHGFKDEAVPGLPKA